MNGPTSRQLACLRVIGDALVAGRPAPTLRELCEAIGITSTNGVADHLRALERRGLIRRPEPVKARSIEVTEAGRQVLGLGSRGRALLVETIVAAAKAWHGARGPEETASTLEALRSATLDLETAEARGFA